ncbi:MAG: UPF0182 family protein [Chitinispirillaceae bacterium]|nr:UPF0182 family protein [Chitinispirillaceae bacterium]
MPRLPANRNSLIAIILISAFLLLVFSGKIVTLLTDYLWFKEINFVSLFFTALYSKIGCGVIAGGGIWLVIVLNIWIASRCSLRSEKYDGFLDPQTLALLARLPSLNVVFLLVAAVVAFFAGTWASLHWEVYLKAMYAVPFGIKDQLFGKDIGFYVFHLPFYRFIYRAVTLALTFSFIGILVYYLLRQNCIFDGRSIRISSPARTQLLVLLGVLCLSLFFSFQFKIYEMVTAQGSLINGAGFSQIKVNLPVLSALRFVSIIAAILVFATIFRKSLRLLGGAVLLLVAVSIAGYLATQAVQKFVVGPDELSKEAPYIGWSIVNTRAAFGLDRIESKPFVPTGNLDAAALARNSQTTGNIRLWEHAPLLTTFSQLQEIRTYYEFLDVDNDRYTINGEYRQVMLSPRELVPSSLPSRTWINEHLTYTHGYGLCLGPVNTVTEEGLPDFFIKNIPPSSTIRLGVSRPQIYYGESDAGYVIVKSGAKEFDYPSGNDNVYTVYDGTGGIRMGGFLRKALFALRFQELKILLRSDITAGSRIMYHRQILDRFHKAAPFLRADTDPYMVITENGRLVWIIDAYTTTNAYPYSSLVTGIGNYIRNSVKTVIDAYNGDLALYITDPDDPIIATYEKVFPRLFKPLTAIPDDLRSHIRYPQTLFTVQARVYSIYHMTDPQVFYNKEDVWRIPDNYTEGRLGAMNPYYTIMKLAGVGEKEEFILMVPFCPAKKENMIAWLAARCDGPDYGSLLVFDFPKQKLVFGPSQIDSRINQEAEISKQLTLWNQGGSRVIRGSLLVIPIEQSLLYVQPLYLASKEGGGVPELKRVIVAFENSIAMEQTLEISLSRIFGTAAPVKPGKKGALSVTEDTAGKVDVRMLITEADRHFTVGQEELRKGNWAGYGEAMKKVERILGELKKTAE